MQSFLDEKFLLCNEHTLSQDVSKMSRNAMEVTNCVNRQVCSSSSIHFVGWQMLNKSKLFNSICTNNDSDIASFCSFLEQFLCFHYKIKNGENSLYLEKGKFQ
jgi:hypothetical protein